MESITLTNDQEKEVQRQLDLYMTGAADVIPPEELFSGLPDVTDLAILFLNSSGGMTSAAPVMYKSSCLCTSFS